jgi:hypothetical protein
MTQSFRENNMATITNDILRLAGVPSDQIKLVVPTQPAVTANICDTHNCVKYVIVDVIDKYTDHYDKSNATNTRSVYSEIINQLDEIVGCLSRHCDEQAIDKFNRLDSKIKRDILKADCDGVAKEFFGCCKEESKDDEPVPATETEEEEISQTEEPKQDDTLTVPFVAKIEKVEESKEKETSSPAYDHVKEVTVPSDVISDIKMKIKELEDGNNFAYYKHLAGADKDEQYHYRIKDALDTLLMYLADANEVSVKNAAIYMSSLDSVTAHKIPASVWKYLSLSFYNKNYTSIRDRMKEITI